MGSGLYLVIQRALKMETTRSEITAFMEKPKLLKKILSMAKKKSPGMKNLADFMVLSLIFMILSFMGIYLVLILSYPILAKREEREGHTVN
jgi:hypothetical protein